MFLFAKVRVRRTANHFRTMLQQQRQTAWRLAGGGPSAAHATRTLTPLMGALMSRTGPRRTHLCA